MAAIMSFARVCFVAAFLVAIQTGCAVPLKEVQHKPDLLLADGSNWRSAAPLKRSQSFAIGIRPRFSWAPRHTLNGQEQTAYQITVQQAHTQRGRLSSEIVWDSGKIESSKPQAAYTGLPLEPRMSYVWSVRYWDSNNEVSEWSEKAEFHVAPVLRANETAWIGGKSTTGPMELNLIRTEFNVKEIITRATLYVCGLGYSYATINGQPASEQLLTTAPWTNNERRNAYSTIEVTSLLKAGSNALGVALGSGWRDQSKFPRKDTDDAKGDAIDRVVWAQVHVLYRDGSEEVVADTASGSWMGSNGPVIADSVYDGETYDASMEQQGWDSVGFELSKNWVTLSPLSDAPRGHLTPWSAPPVGLDKVVQAKSVTEAEPGVFVVDFGVNQAGIVKLSGIKIPKGSNVTIMHGEILQHEGLPDLKKVNPKEIYVGNLRSAKATDIYIAKGDPNGETYSPKFTYHGFRFVQITGMKTLDASQIEMHHIHSLVMQRTNTTTKSQVINQIQRMALGAQRSNMMTVQTDCDQRDERLGWMGDANLSGDSLAANFAIVPYLTSHLETMDDELNPDGSSVDTAPFERYGSRPGDISWTTAYIAAPYAMYKLSGDDTAAKTYIDRMVLHLQNIAMQCHGTAGKSCPTLYGDWVPPASAFGKGQGPKPTKPLTSAFSFIDAVNKVMTMAKDVGNTTLATKLEQQVEMLKDSFNKDFQNANATYDNGVMTSYALPLYLGLVPNATQAAMEKNLENQIVSTFKDHNQCGIIGMKFLYPVLAAMGRQDLALTMLEGTDYPSIGFMAYNKQEPATENLWELWDSLAEGTGMNSRNHHMFSSFSLYIVQHLAGLSQTENSVGFEHLKLEAASTVGLSGANTSSLLSNGEVIFNWERSGGIQCAKVPEGEIQSLSCGQSGGVITKVDFASFGRPIGGCGFFGVDVGCHADVLGMVANACVGNSECTLDPSMFSDTITSSVCNMRDNALNRLFVQVQCSEPQSVHTFAKVPIGSKATLRVPTGGMSSPEVFVDGTKSLSSIPRISRDDRGHKMFEMDLGSGNHQVSLVASNPTKSVTTVANQDEALQINCPDGFSVERVLFATHGLPQKVNGMWTRGSCHLGSVIHDVEEACLGKSTCSVEVSNTEFLDEIMCANAFSVAQVECSQ
eukprot:m.106752 g.106752  ORF g.106752 m.106752 type:complete len:1146 (-) comp13901_c0_seq1:23-3460(-)